MAPRDLSISELLSAIEPFAAEGPTRTFFRASRVGLLYGDEFDELRAFIAPSPAQSVEEQRLTTELTQTDSDHDGHVRFGVDLLSAYAESHAEPRMRDTVAELKGLLFPDGVSLVIRSHADEAGRVAVRAAVMTAEVRAKMRMVPVGAFDGPPITFETWMDTVLQASAARIGSLLEQRNASARGTGPQPIEVLDRKRRLSSLVQELFGAFKRDRTLDAAQKALVAAVEKRWDDAVSLATHNAKTRRRNKGPSEPAPPAA